MEKIMGRIKRTLSVLLAVAMIVTALPQTSAPAYAAEAQNVPDEGVDGAQAEIAEENEGIGSADNGDADAGKETGSDGSGAASDASEEDSSDGTDVSDADGSKETDAPDADESQGADASDDGASEDDGSEETEPEEGTSLEDTDVEEDVTEPEEPEDLVEVGMGYLRNVLSLEDGEEAQTARVRVAIPTYFIMDGKEVIYRSHIKEFKYAVGEEDEWHTWPVEIINNSCSDLYIDEISNGETLRFQFAMADNSRLTDVSARTVWDCEKVPVTWNEGSAEYSLNIEKNEQIVQGAEWDYCIEIGAVRTFACTFVDMYGRDHENTNIVRILYQESIYEYGDEYKESQDVTGQTVQVAGNDLITIEVEEGYTFYSDSIDTDTSYIKLNRYKKDRTKFQYQIWFRDIDKAPDELRVFVTAGPTTSHQLKFEVPDEWADRMEISAYAEKEPLTLENNVVSVADDQNVSFNVKLSGEPTEGIRAVRQDGEGDPTLFQPYPMMYDEDSKCWNLNYDVGYIRDGDTVVSFTPVTMYKVDFVINQDTVDYVCITAPEAIQNDYSDAERVSVYVPDGERLEFDFTPRGEGCPFASTTGDKDGEILCIFDADSGMDYYYVTPTSDMTIYLDTKDYEYTFDYVKSDVQIRVYDHESGEELEPVGDNTFTCKRYDSVFRIMVKPEQGKAVSVRYNGYNGYEGMEDAERDPESDTEDGYLCYIVYAANVKDYRIIIEGYNTHTVTFDVKNDSLRLMRCDYSYNDGYDVYYEWETMKEPPYSITVREGEECLFHIVEDSYDSATHRLEIDIDGDESDSLESDWDYFNNMYFYRFTPTGDTTITLDTVERGICTVTFTGLDQEWFSFSFNEEYTPVEGVEGSYSVREGTVGSIFGINPQDGYRGKVLCTVGGEPQDILPEYDEGDYYYIFVVTGDTAVEISYVPLQQHTITFTNADVAESIELWMDGGDGDYEAVELTDGKISLREDRSYHFRIRLKDGKAVELDSGRPDENGYIYYHVETPQDDMEITFKLVPGYTLTFDTPQKGTPAIYRIMDTDPINNARMPVVAAEGYAFNLAEDEMDRYSVTLDSDLFTLKKVWYENLWGWDAGGYAYTITSKQTENLPSTVKVSVSKYDEHTITLDYPEEIKEISLKRDEKSFPISNKQAVVYGKDTLLSVSTIKGYTAAVSMKGAGEAETLKPFRVYDDSNRTEYYIGELTEDKTITVTLEKITQKQTYYSVNFFSAGVNVDIVDAQYQTPYDVWGKDDEEAFNYSVLKGESISFYVEPHYGYDVDGVYANGTRLTPEFNAKLQKDVYSTVITANTQIRVETGKVEQKYPITFTYPASVKAVTVSGYTLQNNRLEVKADTKLSFTVELADNNHKITSVKVNGKDVAFDQSSGAYTITTAAEPMEVVIATEAAGTPETPDKTALGECINQYKDQYDESEYTPESWAAFAQALQAAEDCMKKADATKAEVDAAVEALKSAAQGLVKKSGEDPNPPTPPTPPVTREGLWFEILENAETADGSYIYTGAAIKPEIRVYNGSTLLEVKKDYTAAYKNNTKAGTATVTVTGKGNYKGKDTADFTIRKKDINADDITVDNVYAIIKANNGTVANPKVTVKDGKKTLKLGTDYKVQFPTESELVKEDGRLVEHEYQIKVTTKGAKKTSGGDVDAENYTGERTITYTVRRSDTVLMSKAKITLSATKVDYAGTDGLETVIPTVTSVRIGSTTLTKDVDYTVSETPENWNRVGKATITVTGKEGTVYYGSKSVTYTVNGTKLAAKNLEISGINPTYDYTGRPIYVSANDEAVSKDTTSDGTLKVKTKGADAKELKEGTDYTVSYKTGKKAGEHTNAGTVTVTITGINAYTGSVTKTFKIVAVDLATFNPTNEENAKEGRVFKADSTAKYTKTGAKPAITKLSFNGADLAEKKDYTISYAKNTRVSAADQTATMTIKGKGNFKGSLTHQYSVTIASDADVVATATDIVKPAKFSQVKPTVKVVEQSTGKALKAGTDYERTITYYSDAAFENEITADNFDKPIAAGDTKTPTDIDAEIYAKITLKGSYAGTGTTPGTITAQFRVYNKDQKLSDAKKYIVTIDTTKAQDGSDIKHDTSAKKNPFYTGSQIRPKVTVTIKGTNETLKEGTHYRVEYGPNINKGKGTVTVIGKGGGCGGSKSVTFTIVSADMTWAEQTVKQAAEILSNLIPALD